MTTPDTSIFDIERSVDAAGSWFLTTPKGSRYLGFKTAEQAAGLVLLSLGARPSRIVDQRRLGRDRVLIHIDGEWSE